jgi:formylglycine-generating enzyme required for sulfatase activity
MVLDEVSPGAHELRVSALQKKEYLQRVVVTAGQETSLEAQLVDAPGSIRLRTLAGASITLDGAGRGSTDANGELVLGDLSPGAHQLQVSAPQKKAYLQTVMVTAGQESRVEATLLDALPPLPQVRENPKDGLKYVWIPPGSFEMGCSRGDNVCFADEKPSHHVVLTKGFWLGQTEVTVGAFQRFAEATVRHLPRAPKFDANWANDRFPIVNVNWSGARDYCKWAGGRLPTEAEWEYAARGGSGEVRYGELGDIAWSNENSQGQAHEVAQKRANAFGLYDLLGNVGEWVNDWYEKTYYQNSPSQDPSGPTSGSTRVLRGGSWNGSAWDLRVSGRYGSNPDLANDYVGFRCVGETSSP